MGAYVGASVLGVSVGLKEMVGLSVGAPVGSIEMVGADDGAEEIL